MMQSIKQRLHLPYLLMLIVYGLFIITALMSDSPAGIFEGLKRIMTSSSVLLTDYIYIGGIGAALINSALAGCFSILMLVLNKAKPNGSIIMALWLTAGFSLFGKNLYNMLPITCGVYLYSKFKKEPFANYSLVALLSATLSPVVSAVSFTDIVHTERSMVLGILCGISVGFFFPAVSSFTASMHKGYSLYNMGFAGGIISTFLVAGLSSIGINIETQITWSKGNNLILGILLYIVFTGMISCGLAFGGGIRVVKNYPAVVKNTGRSVSDFYSLYGYEVYFNMGVTGMAATTVMLLQNCDLNGPTLGGIFTIVGFSAFGKHLKNILPLMLGAILSTRVNMWDPSTPFNTLAILFSTGLAPIAGKFGIIWGIIAGFLHVNTVLHIGFLNSGLNLYNNGYAAGFVVILLLPIIMMFKSDS